MAFCGNCGAEINDGAKFCPVCGTVQAAPGAQQQQQQQPRRSKYDNAVGQDAQFEEITNEDSTNPTSPSCSYTPSPKVSDAKWEEIN